MNTTRVADRALAGPVAPGAEIRPRTVNGAAASVVGTTGSTLLSAGCVPAIRAASLAQQQLALVVCLVLLAATALLSPYAAISWPNFPAFIPAYQTAAIGTCLITAGLMYGHYAASRSTVLLHLSAGYAYAAGVLVLQFLSFPGVLVESGRLLGGPKSVVWLWAFWHIGPACSVLLFAWTEYRRPRWVTQGRGAVLATGAVLLTALVATALAVTVLHDRLPALDIDGNYGGSAVFSAVTLGVGLSLAGALALMWRASAFRNLLHVWLGMVVVALICDNAITLFAGSRFAMGWYFGRLVALLAFSVMMTVYLHEVFTAYRRTLNLAGALALSNGQLDREIEQRKVDSEKLLRADRSKDEALVTLAHELRGPLAPLSSVAQLLSTGALDGKGLKRTGEVLQRQIRLMTTLVEDLMDVSRVTRGLAVLHVLEASAQQIISDAVEQVIPLIESKEQVLALQVPDSPVMVRADPARMVQVLTNLLNNAAKYTPRGGAIHLRLDAGEASVAFYVSDNGIGMTPELLNRAFELFSQGELTSDRTGGGLGVGLALVKSLVELHGGQVHGTSAGPGRGSEFSVTLPAVSCGDGSC